MGIGFPEPTIYGEWSFTLDNIRSRSRNVSAEISNVGNLQYRAYESIYLFIFWWGIHAISNAIVELSVLAPL